MEKGTNNPGEAAELSEAVNRFNQGRYREAETLCRRILDQEPENVTALNVLAGSLARAGNVAEAIQAAEQVCALVPGDAGFYSNLSYLHSLAGNYQKAMLVMAHAVINDPAGTAHQAKFARLVENVEFYRQADEMVAIREAIRICLDNPALDAASFSTAWHSLVVLEPLFAELEALTAQGDFQAQAEELDISELTGLLSDPFLLRGLQALHAVDERLERILTFLRWYFLVHAETIPLEPCLPFLCALAEHCLLNEYIYAQSSEEPGMVDRLAENLPDTLDAQTMARVALVYCYRDPLLLDLPAALASPDVGSGDADFSRLVKNAVAISGASRKFEEQVPVFSASPDSRPGTVSSSVARQYEENPYPRWRHLEIPQLQEAQKAKGRDRNILVAGCGTGFEPLTLAAHYPEARVLGVDLSVPSLAYGMQKAEEFGIRNVEFLQADILDLDGLDRQFDMITSVGVLHHMEDPVVGWRKLLGCLKPDGFMKIALYSEAARQSVVACRDWIEERGFEPTPDGIREFRQSIMALDADDPLREIMNWTDFYSLSMCRDLVFHVQEHRVTLPWIGSALGELGLTCLSMRISNPEFKKEYLSMFPADRGLRNLENLHEYETHNPRAFRDMYQFRCCSKGSVTAQRPPAWFFTPGL